MVFVLEKVIDLVVIVFLVNDKFVSLIFFLVVGWYEVFEFWVILVFRICGGILV